MTTDTVTAVQPTAAAGRGQAPRVWMWTLASVGVLLVAVALACAVGPARLDLASTLRSLLGQSHGLAGIERTVLFEIRVPRVVLGVLVGAALAASGSAYQTVFRNPLADPYLLGVAAGAGLGATLAITGRMSAVSLSLPLFAFAGAVVAVMVTLGLSGRLGRDPVSTVLAGVAVASFATAVQTYLQQRNSTALRPVYSWILGQLTTAGWESVRAVAVYILVALGGLFWLSRTLDALQLSDDEATSLGVSPRRVRMWTVAAATLATAAAVSVSGLIGFVGIVVPHLVRYLTGVATARLLPMIAVCGAAFVVLADLGARLVLAPAEVPIGVITAFIGAPFFLFVLRNRAGVAR